MCRSQNWDCGVSKFELALHSALHVCEAAEASRPEQEAHDHLTAVQCLALPRSFDVAAHIVPHRSPEVVFLSHHIYGLPFCLC